MAAAPTIILAVVADREAMGKQGITAKLIIATTTVSVTAIPEEEAMTAAPEEREATSPPEKETTVAATTKTVAPEKGATSTNKGTKGRTLEDIAPGQVHHSGKPKRVPLGNTYVATLGYGKQANQSRHDTENGGKEGR